MTMKSGLIIRWFEWKLNETHPHPIIGSFPPVLLLIRMSWSGFNWNRNNRRFRPGNGTIGKYPKYHMEHRASVPSPVIGNHNLDSGILFNQRVVINIQLETRSSSSPPPLLSLASLERVGGSVGWASGCFGGAT